MYKPLIITSATVLMVHPQGQILLNIKKSLHTTSSVNQFSSISTVQPAVSACPALLRMEIHHESRGLTAGERHTCSSQSRLCLLVLLSNTSHSHLADVSRRVCNNLSAVPATEPELGGHPCTHFSGQVFCGRLYVVPARIWQQGM